MRYIRPENAADPNLLVMQHEGSSWKLQLLHGATGEYRERASHFPHVHDVYHIVLYTRGENEVRIDDQRVRCGPGMLVLCPPGVSHDFGPVNRGGIEYDEITFQFTSAGRLLALPFAQVLSFFTQRRIADIPLRVRVSSWGMERIRQLIGRVVTEAGSGSVMSLFRAHVAIAELFALVLEEVGTEQAADPVSLAHRNITIRYAQPLGIVALAEELGISPAYLSRAFKKRYGVSPVQFRQQLRLEAAARLLQTSSLSCKEVAARLGFADVQSFTKAFVRHHGHTPGRFSRITRRWQPVSGR